MVHKMHRSTEAKTCHGEQHAKELWNKSTALFCFVKVCRGVLAVVTIKGGETGDEESINDDLEKTEPTFIRETTDEKMWRAVGWTCDQRQKAVLVFLI